MNKRIKLIDVFLNKKSQRKIRSIKRLVHIDGNAYTISYNNKTHDIHIGREGLAIYLNP